MKWWSVVKPWVQPLVALIVVLYAVFQSPGWSPAGTFERVFNKTLTDKETGSVNSAFHSMVATYALMILFALGDSLYRLLAGSWRRASISAMVVTRNGKQSVMYLAVADALGADIGIEVAFKNNDQVVFDRLRSFFSDLMLEVFWNPQDLSLTSNGLSGASIVDDGITARMELAVFDRFTCAGGSISPGVVVQVSDPAISKSPITPRLVSRKHPVLLRLAVWSRLISGSMGVLTVEVQK